MIKQNHKWYQGLRTLGGALAKVFRSVFSKRTLIIACISFALAEVCVHYWLHHFADKNQFIQFATFEDIVERYPLRFQRHHYLNYDLAPGYKKKRMTHDEFGYRGPKFNIKKSENAFRIVAIGGSTTYTEKVNNDKETYPAQLEKKLRALGYNQVEVINAGVPGYTSWESLINLQFRVLYLSPDLVIVYHGVNDAHARLVDPKRYVGDNSGYRLDWQDPPSEWYNGIDTVRIATRLFHPSEFSDGVSQFAIRPDVYTQYRPSPISKYKLIKKNPPRYFEQNLANMIGIARINGFGIMFATWAGNPGLKDYISKKAYKRAISEHNKVITELGPKYGVPVFDFAAKMPTTDCRSCWADGRHVTAEGAAIKAALFAEFIDDQNLIQ